jgi:hypothetical protein
MLESDPSKASIADGSGRVKPYETTERTNWETASFQVYKEIECSQTIVTLKTRLPRRWGLLAAARMSCADALSPTN